VETLHETIAGLFGAELTRVTAPDGELAYEVLPSELLTVAQRLRDEPLLRFEMLVDVAGVDYLTYGEDEWKTNIASTTGFSRGVSHAAAVATGDGRRFAVAYQLLSITHNQRLRLRVWCEDALDPSVDSLTGIWASADWFEREAYDLFGILFRNHPDMRRLLTDYGFIGHPFRKDFPLIGNVEVRYDPAQKRVVYEPVTIEARTLVPRVIRHDNRYDAALRSTPAAGGK
jgi:NADH-quinone oxidoreductase subunit C